MDELKIYEAINQIDKDLLKGAANAADFGEQADAETDAITVSGVSVHHRSIWRIAAGAAAMVLFIAGAGTAGYMIMRNAPSVPPDANEAMPLIPTEAVSEAASTGQEITAAHTKELTDKEKAEIKRAEEEIQQHIAEETEKARKAAEEQAAISAEMQEEELQQNLTSEEAKQAEAELKVAEEQIEKEIQEAFQQPPVSPAEPAEIPTTAPAIPYTDRWPSTPCPAELLQLLDSLTYVPETCDGLPEFALQAENGTLYQINMSGSGWVWRNGVEEAQMTEEVRSALLALIEANRITPYVWN